MSKNCQTIENPENEQIAETVEDYVLKALGLRKVLDEQNPLSRRMEDRIKISILNLQKLFSEELKTEIGLSYQEFIWRPQEMVELLNRAQFKNGLAVTFKNRDRRFHVFLPAELVYQLSAQVLNSKASSILTELTEKESTAICFLIAKILSESESCKGIYLCSSIVLSGKPTSKEFTQFLNSQCVGSKIRAISISVLLEQVTHQILIYADASLLEEFQEEESQKLELVDKGNLLRGLKAKYKIKINIQAGLLANLFNLQNRQIWEINLGHHNASINTDQLSATVEMIPTESPSRKTKFTLPIEMLPETVPGKLALKFQNNNQPNKESL